MAKFRKSKNNGKYFQVIDRPKDRADQIQDILRKLKHKYTLKQDRARLVHEARELRKQVYNLSQKINALEIECDRIMLETMIDKQNDYDHSQKEEQDEKIA